MQRPKGRHETRQRLQIGHDLGMVFERVIGRNPDADRSKFVLRSHGHRGLRGGFPNAGVPYGADAAAVVLEEHKRAELVLQPGAEVGAPRGIVDGNMRVLAVARELIGSSMNSKQADKSVLYTQ